MSDYSPETTAELVDLYARSRLHRPLRVGWYDPGRLLRYSMTGLIPAVPVEVVLTVEKFVGGGFAGQVYKVRVTAIDAPQGPIPGLDAGATYALKVLTPPSRWSRAFRDLIYALGFQAPFQLQVNPDAAVAGGLWQKFIRRAAAGRFGDDRCVVDVLATFVDENLGSCGEISEWVDGRNWRLEVDDNLLARWVWKPGRDDEGLGSPEYRAKRRFMSDIVQLFHDVGAPELARQYEWWTCKSQPNALKRLDAGDEPARGLTAVDFRAGLALLPVLPMSPGDVKLIAKGLARGSLVQFDRGDTRKLREYVETHREQFAGMGDALERLIEHDEKYRRSQIDLAGNNVKLLYSPGLWSQICGAAVTGWRVRNVTDDATDARLRGGKALTLLFAALGLAPAAWVAAAVMLILWLAKGGAAAGWVSLGLAAGAVMLKRARHLVGRADYRRHVVAEMTIPNYAVRAFRGRAIEAAVRWHGAGRINASWAIRLAKEPCCYVLHLPLSFLPVFLHRMLTDGSYLLSLVRDVLVRPVRLYFNSELRERWLYAMVAAGRERHLLTDEDAKIILSRIREPFIQKYLKSLAVHVCTLPITQVVSVIVAIWFVVSRGLTGREAWLAAGGILAAFQIVPVSPGSFVRGMYVVYLVIRERDFKNYNIAVFLGFMKYVGYLAFPIQMAYRYPVLARFMAAHWATGAVHVVPVFGEHGALLEHFVFDLFYNYPLTVRRKLRERAKIRSARPPRRWHFAALAITAAGAIAAVEGLWRGAYGALPALPQIWYVVVAVPVLLGVVCAACAGSMPTPRRIRNSLLAALAAGLMAGAVHAAMVLVPSLGGQASQQDGIVSSLISHASWVVAVFVVLGTVAAVLSEMLAPEPRPAVGQPASQARKTN